MKHRIAKSIPVPMPVIEACGLIALAVLMAYFG